MESTSTSVVIRPIQARGWLETLPRNMTVEGRALFDLIEQRADATHREGQKPLWEGYRGLQNYKKSTEGMRKPNEVRSEKASGRAFTSLVEQRSAKKVVEFGGAFGVSGMYWLAGLKTTGGHLYSFEPNAVWAKSAKANFEAVYEGHTLTVDTFENAAARVLSPASIDIAFVDAIHTSEFVNEQYAILKPFMRPGALILFDDVTFSQDMKDCWVSIATDASLAGSVTINSRIGMIQLPE